MSIKNSCRYTLAGLGTASLRGGSVTVTTPLALTMTGVIGPLTNKINCGTLRLKVSGLTGTGALASFVITATDGTTVIYLDAMTITGGVANQGMDVMSEFQSDENLQQFNFSVTFSVAPTAATIDFEVWGQENAGGP
jgi:hypothetical protein